MLLAVQVLTTFLSIVSPDALEEDIRIDVEMLNSKKHAKECSQNPVSRECQKYSRLQNPMRTYAYIYNPYNFQCKLFYIIVSKVYKGFILLEVIN